MTWKVLLVPHDFSASANHATALARDEAKLHGARLVLVHVIDLPYQIGPMAIVPPETGAPINVRDYAVSQAKEHLDDLVARLGKDGATATGVVCVGNPVDEILRVAGDEKADAIVMGTHGRTGIRHLIAGSVAERVVRAATVPVITVRHPS